MPKTNHRLKWNGSLSPVRVEKGFKSTTSPSGFFPVLSGTTATLPTTTVATKLVVPYGSGAVAPASGMVFVSGSGMYFSDGGAFKVVWGA
jgi:hypothetical protein